MNECKIVEDLLPLYVEELVSRETGDFVRRHLDECEECRNRMHRMNAPLVCEENTVDYKKNLRKDIWKICGKVLLTAFIVVAVFAFVLWEWGFLDRQIYKSPDGGMYFEVIDADSGFFEGGAYIVTPDGRGRNLYGDNSYRDFHVWFSPDSEKYFVWIEFEDHDETYLVCEKYGWSEDGSDFAFQNTFYPSYEISERDFLEILKTCGPAQEYLTEGNISITFDRWTQNSRFIYFNYEMDGGYTGEIWFDTDELYVCNFSKIWPGTMVTTSTEASQ